MLTQIFALFICSIVCAASPSPSYPPFKLVKYRYDGPGVSNDRSLTLFRRILGPTCSIYKQEDTKDVFMFLYAGLGGGNGEWTISNEVSARDSFVCTIHIPPLNDYPNQKLPTLKYTNSWNVFPCKEIEGIAIVNDPATDCSNETMETFRRKVGKIIFLCLPQKFRTR